jgi:ferrochelatase
VSERLGLNAGEAITTFQSRFGRAEWLQPYTDETLKKLGRSGTQRIDVICPGFAADCLETLEEIADEGKETFLHAGGKTFNYLPVANESEPFMRALTTIVLENLGGWVSTDWDDAAALSKAQQSATLAKTMGAAK